MKKLLIVLGLVVALPGVAILGLLMMFVAATVGNSSATGQVGNCSLSSYSTWKNGICRVYPGPGYTVTQDEDNLPVPGMGANNKGGTITAGANQQADITTFESLLPFQPATPGQIAFINQCYATWAINTTYGGSYCAMRGQEKGYPGQCTFWALLNWDNPNMPTISGNAVNFYNDAGAVPYQSQTPTLGALAVFHEDGNLYPSSAGHVAIVVQVNSASSFVVSEMNWLTPWTVQYRVITSSHGVFPGLTGFVASAPGGIY